MATTSARDATQLGAAVREARIRAGLSQSELAADANVGRQWLVGFEAGDKLSAPFDMVMRVLRTLALEVTLDVSVPKRSRAQGHGFSPTATEVVARHQRSDPR